MHRRRDDIRALRARILACDPGLSEKIKWNAPSFCWQGEGRVTLRLQSADRLQIIFHRGAKPLLAEGFRFGDPSGLLHWVAPDRGVFDVADLAAQKDVIQSLVRGWIVAAAA